MSWLLKTLYDQIQTNHLNEPSHDIVNTFLNKDTKSRLYVLCDKTLSRQISSMTKYIPKATTT